MNDYQKKFRILVVDDDIVNIFLLKTLIQKILPESATLFEATNGREAIEQFNKEEPDLIFMDIQMPEMNGYEATIEIRKMKTNRRIPIVAVTAGIIQGNREKCLNVGMDDYASKPVTKTTIEQLIRKWLLIIEK